VDVWSKGILDRETQKAKEQVLVNNGIPQNFLNIIVLGFLDSHTCKCIGSDVYMCIYS
jgi:hypothetical protein